MVEPVATHGPRTTGTDEVTLFDADECFGITKSFDQEQEPETHGKEAWVQRCQELHEDPYKICEDPKIPRALRRPSEDMRRSTDDRRFARTLRRVANIEDARSLAGTLIEPKSFNLQLLLHAAIIRGAHLRPWPRIDVICRILSAPTL